MQGKHQLVINQNRLSTNLRFETLKSGTEWFKIITKSNSGNLPWRKVETEIEKRKGLGEERIT